MSRLSPLVAGPDSVTIITPSPEVVAASAINGEISGPGWWQKPEGVENVIIGEGSGKPIVARSFEDAFDKLLDDAEGHDDRNC